MNRYRMNSLMAAMLFVGLSAVAGSAVAQKAPWVGETLDGRACRGGDVPRNFGPFDYITERENLFRVDDNHFSPQVEQLRQGDTTRHPMGDVDFTLIRYPNHHRALYTAVRFSLGESKFGELRKYPAECYLQRGINFSPEDSVPYMLYGLYLHRLGHLDESLEKYQAAEELAPKDPNLLYNLGLLHFDIGNYELSQQYATEAYSLGIEFPGLRRKLQEAGHWE